MESPGLSTSKQFSLRHVIIDDSVLAKLVNDSDSDEYKIEDNQNIKDTVSNSSEDGETISEPPTGQTGNGEQPDKQLTQIYEGKKILLQ
jgi:hypothetical protein